ncbi:MAG TPA: polysaccharide deacetylase family protein [Burkholderiales bacterium]|nr:polysaccharide deacetylase family protein [Burkholderiales bacterium]
MKLALKIDVDTYHGTREGVPRLARLLERRGVAATFLFSLGPDHTGRAVRRVFRAGFLGKVSRTSVLSHYGLKTLLYGTLLPGPDIGRRCAAELRAVRAAGFEVGVHCWDHVRWQDEVTRRDAAWTRRELMRALERFEEVFGAPPRVHGAAGWQTNAHALRLLDELGFACASDTRGREPFLPSAGGEAFTCPQLPTTLPTFDELIGIEGASAADAARRILALCASAPAAGHVFTAHAELEGGRLTRELESLLDGWRALGYQIVSLGTMAAALDRARLPRYALELGTVPGRSGTLAVQGAALAA